MTDPEVEVQRIPLTRPLHPARDVQALAAVRGLIDRFRPRLVHTHMAKAGVVGRVAVMTSTHKARTVHTFHGHVLQGYFGPVSEKVFTAIERWLAHRTDVLVAVSKEVKDDLLALGIGTPEKITVVPLGFDLSTFVGVSEHSGALRTQLGLDHVTPLVGAIGRLVPIKDHLTLIQAIARLDDVHLALLGDGESRSALVAEVDRLGVADRIHLVGWRKDVADCISDVDVVALTSRNEGTPVSLIEALACARPVVATDVGGVRSVVEDGVTGLLVAPGDAEAVVTSIKRLLEDRRLGARMAEEGRRRVQALFGKERLLSDIQGIYEALLA